MGEWCFLDCDICNVSKQQRLPFNKSTAHAIRLFQLVHIYLWGPYRKKSIDGVQYMLTVLDD